MTNALTLGTGPLQIEVWPLGARLNRVLYDGTPCVDAAETREEALGPKRYNGAVVGPVANRLAGGSVSIAGKSYVLPRNENNETTLHSGPQGVHALDWNIADQDATSVTFALALSDGFGGLPGQRVVRASYDVGGHSVEVTFEATSTMPTVMNMALHPYWTLDAGGREGLQISVNADRYTPVDAKKIPTGKIADVAGTIFDLTDLQVPSTEIDHNFCLTGGDDAAVTLTGKRLRMEMWTDAPGCQVFTGKPNGIAIEPQDYPDAPHHDAFPSILLAPGETYRQISTYHFSRL